MPRTPAISVVVVTRDRPALLKDALAGIARQTLAPLEVVVADDGDAPLDPSGIEAGVLALRLLRSDARCAAAARNLGARAAMGEVLAFLDDDDVWHPAHLDGLARAFQDPDAGLAYRDVDVVREEEAFGARIERDRRRIARDWDPEMMRHDDYIPPSALAIRSDLFRTLSGFDESFRYSEDWDLLLRAAAHTRPRRVPGVTVEVRMRPVGNASAVVNPERRACLDRLSARHGLPPLSIKTFWEVAEALAGEAAR